MSVPQGTPKTVFVYVPVHAVVCVLAQKIKKSNLTCALKTLCVVSACVRACVCVSACVCVCVCVCACICVRVNMSQVRSEDGTAALQVMSTGEGEKFREDDEFARREGAMAQRESMSFAAVMEVAAGVDVTSEEFLLLVRTCALSPQV